MQTFWRSSPITQSRKIDGMGKLSSSTDTRKNSVEKNTGTATQKQDGGEEGPKRHDKAQGVSDQSLRVTWTLAWPAEPGRVSGFSTSCYVSLDRYPSLRRPYLWWEVVQVQWLFGTSTVWFRLTGNQECECCDSVQGEVEDPALPTCHHHDVWQDGKRNS